MSKKFYGKYRGLVIDNADPTFCGRLVVGVPAVYGDFQSPWALPALPAASLGSGIFSVPAPGASVWVEFERGDPQFPIWTGGFWPNPGESPEVAKLGPETKIVLQTMLGNFLMLDDPEEGITLQTTVGHSININAEGITLKTSTGNILSISDAGITMTTTEGGSIAIEGTMVQINDGALMVI